MTAAEFALLQRTSVVTLSIAGIFKEVLTISAASLVFEDHLTVVNFIGLLTTLAAIVAYNYLKITKMRQEALHSDGSHHGQSPTGDSSNNNSDLDDDVPEENAGLLRQSFEMDEPVGSGSSSSHPHRLFDADDHLEYKSERQH